MPVPRVESGNRLSGLWARRRVLTKTSEWRRSESRIHSALQDGREFGQNKRMEHLKLRPPTRRVRLAD
jgi:hypothetical protein